MPEDLGVFAQMRLRNGTKTNKTQMGLHTFGDTTNKKVRRRNTNNFYSLKRCVAESNRLEWFCRPVPNRSDNAPFLISECKGKDILINRQKFSNIFNKKEAAIEQPLSIEC